MWLKKSQKDKIATQATGHLDLLLVQISVLQPSWALHRRGLKLKLASLELRLFSKNAIYLEIFLQLTNPIFPLSERAFNSEKDRLCPKHFLMLLFSVFEQCFRPCQRNFRSLARFGSWFGRTRPNLASIDSIRRNTSIDVQFNCDSRFQFLHV